MSGIGEPADGRAFEAALRRGLATRDFGHPLHFHPSVDSTNVRAATLARDGAAHGTAVIADAQRRGKGRLGRRWVSPPGVNLYLSVILRPAKPAADAPQLSLLAAVGVARTIAGQTSLSPVIKWPNDVLVSDKKVAGKKVAGKKVAGKKVCGVLTEMQAEGQRLRSVVVGIGVNLNAPRAAFPPELRDTAASLRLLAGRPLDRAAFTLGLLAHLEKLYAVWVEEGFSGVAQEWEGFAAPLLDRPMTVSAPGGTVTGIARGLDRDGALLLETEPGRPPRRIVAGDVSVVPEKSRGTTDTAPSD